MPMHQHSELPYAPNTWQQFAGAHGLEHRPVVAFGFNPHWRKTLENFVQSARIRHTRNVKKIPEGAVVLVWGISLIHGLPENCTVVRLEDGFLRSVGLGAEFARPLSWVVDFNHLYFDAEGPSRLENLLSTHVFTEQERERARQLLYSIEASGVTKYNTGHGRWQRPDNEVRVILVPGQVESDASIRLGSPQTKTNMDLLRQVRENNPEAWVIYKPHPDVAAGARNEGEKESDAQFWCNEVVAGVGMDTLLAQVDEVHTITSLTGFEALVRNKSVTCYGLPFYAGWGLTSDMVACQRRRRCLELSELAHAVLVQYPFYVSRHNGNYILPEQTLNEIQEWRGTSSPWQDLLKKQARRLISLTKGKT